MFAEDDLARRKAEREAADKAYNDALTALDRVFPKIPEMPHPPVPYDEFRVSALNERWSVVGDPPHEAFSGWKRKVGAFVWEMLRPIFERQEAFNSVLVDHVNRNVAVHRANREAIAATLGTVKSELEKAESFHAKLILLLQSITLYVDTKDRSEHIARLVNITTSGLDGVGNEFQRRWEAMVAREQRYVSAVDELRTGMGTVQQTGLTLKRELERLLTNGVPAASAPATDTPAAPASPASPVPAAQSSTVNAHVNAYKYVGFENKFRGSEAEIRSRQLDYVKVFAGATDVLDLGCGRGEFLALLREHGIRARGLDINHEMAEACRARGLTVDEADALSYLSALPDASLGGLIALQVVEHFQPAYLLQFLELAYHKLRPGAAIVLETLNPSCWFAFFEAYIRDITHAWPLHPDTLKYLVMASGFQRLDVRLLSPYPGDAKLQHCAAPAEMASSLGMTGLVQSFNENVDKVNSLMFGYLDYAVVARKG
jgi:SAM-dependent methyltransferase